MSNPWYYSKLARQRRRKMHERNAKHVKLVEHAYILAHMEDVRREMVTGRLNPIRAQMELFLLDSAGHALIIQRLLENLSGSADPEAHPSSLRRREGERHG
jgi:hypothetical protein